MEQLEHVPKRIGGEITSVEPRFGEYFDHLDTLVRPIENLMAPLDVIRHVVLGTIGTRPSANREWDYCIMY